MPSTAVSLKGTSSPLRDVLAVVALPLRDEGLTLVVARRHGDDVVERALDDVGGLVDEIGPLGQHRGVVALEFPVVGQRLALLAGGIADGLGSVGPLAVTDPVDRLLRGEEQGPHPEECERKDGRHRADAAPFHDVLAGGRYDTANWAMAPPTPSTVAITIPVQSPGAQLSVNPSAWSRLISPGPVLGRAWPWPRPRAGSGASSPS